MNNIYKVMFYICHIIIDMTAVNSISNVKIADVFNEIQSSLKYFDPSLTSTKFSYTICMV